MAIKPATNGHGMNKWILLAIAISITLIGRHHVFHWINDFVTYAVALYVERPGLVALFIMAGAVGGTIEPALRWFRRVFTGA